MTQAEAIARAQELNASGERITRIVRGYDARWYGVVGGVYAGRRDALVLHSQERPRTTKLNVGMREHFYEVPQ